MARLHAFVPVHACLSGSGRYLLGRNRPRAVERPDERKEESMAGSVNKVTLVGNLGADPEARSLNNGGEVVNLRVATSETWKDQSGQRQERPEWHRVVIFNENLRSEEHTSELQALMRITYAVFCLKKKREHTVEETEGHQQHQLVRINANINSITTTM